MKSISTKNEESTTCNLDNTNISALPTADTLNQQNKIIALEEIANTISPARTNKKVIQCHGVFDLLHIGHIKHLQHAKSLGDLLVVTITPDHYVNKGPGRPYFTQTLRAEALAALDCVDYVVINQSPTAIEPIKIIKPDCYVKGIEYQAAENDITGKICEEEIAVKSVGGNIIFTDDIVFSSSTLLNRFFSPFSPEVVAFLEQFKQKYQFDQIHHYLENAKKLKVLLIGETIIDIYHYGEAIGKSGKEPVLVTKYHREDIYVGGVLAIANHLSSFCAEVTCITMLGERGDYEGFIKDNLRDNVNIIFHNKAESPTIVKRRYIEEYSSQKLFEIYEIDDCYLNEQQQKEFTTSIEKHISDHDVVVVADYGHGLLDNKCVTAIEDKAKFLAVNTQANASNHGFNCISKYKKADYVCIANRELQLNYRQKHISVLDQIKQLVQEYAFNNVMVTSGVKGSYSCKTGEGIYAVPAFTTSVKDRVGAGDAVLAVTSLLVAQNAPAELVGFVGNVVGSQAVNIMGNKSFIEKVPLLKHLAHLLK